MSGKTNNSPSEYTVTCQVADYLRWLNVPFIHIPNEAKREPKTGAMLKRMGLSAGFPDMFIFVPTKDYHGLAIELKREKGGTVSDAQKEWIERLNRMGYKAVVCKGTQEALDEIERYLNGRKTNVCKVNNIK